MPTEKYEKNTYSFSQYCYKRVKNMWMCTHNIYKTSLNSLLKERWNYKNNVLNTIITTSIDYL